MTVVETEMVVSGEAAGAGADVGGGVFNAATGAVDVGAGEPATGALVGGAEDPAAGGAVC